MLTGASGHVGVNTIKALNELDPKLKVKVLIQEGEDDRCEEKLRGCTFEMVHAKEQGKENPSLFKGVTALFLIPPPLENRVEVARKIINGAKQAGVKFLMTPAHLSVRQNETVLSKMFRQIEDDMKKTGIPHCFLHSEVFMDMQLADADEIKKKGSFSCVVDPDARFNPIAVKDLGEVAAKILACPDEHEDTRYTLTGPGSLSMTDMADMYSKLVGKDVKYVKDEPQVCVEGYKKRGFNEWFAKALVELEENLSGGEFDFTSGDVLKLLERPPISFPEFLEQHKHLFV